MRPHSRAGLADLSIQVVERANGGQQRLDFASAELIGSRTEWIRGRLFTQQHVADSLGAMSQRVEVVATFQRDDEFPSTEFFRQVVGGFEEWRVRAPDGQAE